MAVLPASGWLVRLELRMVGARPGPDLFAERAVPVPADDYELRLASALNATPTGSEPVGGIVEAQVRSLLPLRQQFGDKPGLYADILRYLAKGDLRLGREEEVQLSARRAPDGSVNKPVPVRPEVLALTEECAVQGERLDPQNAYFPAMQAIGLFAAHRDSDALAALHRAALAPRWEEYTREEVEARWRLAELRQGKTGAMPRLAIAASLLLPHLAPLQSMTRTAIVLAMQREVAGDPAAGFAIRQDVAQLGAMMRVKSPNMIGSLVGIAMTGASAARPAGAPAFDNALANDARSAASDARYIAYLTRIGHPETAAWYTAERRAGEKVRDIIRIASDESLFGTRDFVRLGAAWGAGMLFLVNILWTLIWGGVAALLTRTPRVRSNQSLHPGIFVGLCSAIWLPASFFGLQNTGFESGASDISVLVRCVFWLIVGLVLPLFLLWRSVGKAVPALLRGLGIAAVTVVAVDVLATTAVYSFHGALGYVGMLQTLEGCASSDGLLNFNPWVGPDGVLSGSIVAGLALLCPILCTVFFALSGCRRPGVPASVLILRGLASSALPVAGILLLGYTAIVGATVVEERSVNDRVEQMLHDEGRAEAGLAHQEWPGPVRIAGLK